MSVQVKRRRDTAANVAAYAGAQGELIVDTTNNRVTVHDGATAGGFTAAKLSEVLLSGTALLTLAIGSLGFGSAFKVGVLEQSVTLSGATTTASVNIPANCILLGVGERVATAVTGATSFSVGTSGTPGQFGSGLGIAGGSTNYGIIGPVGVYSATPIIITAAGGSFTGGVLHLAIFYIQITPPTS